MPKIKFKDIKSEFEESFDARRFYENKYFGLFLNAYKFKGLSRTQTRYLLKRLWAVGTCAAFIMEGTKQEPSLKALLQNNNVSTAQIVSDNENGLLVLSPYAATHYNIYDEPSVVNLINQRGATFIPTKLMKVNKDVVLLWAHSSHAPLRSLVRFYIDKIVDVEKTIDMNLFVHKLPRLVVCSPEDKARVQDLMEAIEQGEKKIFIDSQDVTAIKNVLETGSNTSYIIDKLYSYKQSLENELLTFFGFNNISMEKKERLITDEANANNQLINDCGQCFFDTIKEACEDIKEILGYNIEVEMNSAPVMEEMPEDEEGEEDNEEM